MENNLKYIFFPVFLLKDLNRDKKGVIQNIFSIGIYRYAKKIQYDSVETVYRQVMYAYYRSPSELQQDLKDLLGDLEDNDELTLDDDHNGFDGDTFNPDREIKELIEAAEYYTDLETMAIEFYQMHQAKQTLELRFSIDTVVHAAQQQQRQIEEFEKKHGTDASVSLKIDMLQRYFKEDQTEFSLDLFKAYAAIKSVIGAKPVHAFVKATIAQRMVGAKSRGVLEELLKDPVIKAQHERYSTRYWMDKLIDQLEDKKFLVKLSYGRRIYISTKHTKLELGKVIVKYKQNKEKNTRTALRKKEDAALRKQISQALK